MQLLHGVCIIFWRDKKVDQHLMLYNTKFSFTDQNLICKTEFGIGIVFSKIFKKYLTCMYNGEIVLH